MTHNTHTLIIQLKSYTTSFFRIPKKNQLKWTNKKSDFAEGSHPNRETNQQSCDGSSNMSAITSGGFRCEQIQLPANQVYPPLKRTAKKNLEKK